MILEPIDIQEVLIARWCSLGPDSEGLYQLEDDDTGLVVATGLEREFADHILRLHNDHLAPATEANDGN